MCNKKKVHFIYLCIFWFFSCTKKPRLQNEEEKKIKSFQVFLEAQLPIETDLFELLHYFGFPNTDHALVNYDWHSQEFK